MNFENEWQLPVWLWPNGVVHYYYVRPEDNLGLPIWDGNLRQFDNRPTIDFFFQRWSDLLFNRIVFRRLEVWDDTLPALRVEAMSTRGQPAQYALGGNRGDSTIGIRWRDDPLRLRLTVTDNTGTMVMTDPNVAMHEIAHTIGCSHGLARSDRDRCVRYPLAGRLEVVPDRLFQRNYAAPGMDHDPPIEEYDYYSCIGGQSVSPAANVRISTVDLWGNEIRRGRFHEIASPGDISKILQWYQMERHRGWGFFRSLATFPADPTTPRTSELPLPDEFRAGGVGGRPRRTFPIGSPAIAMTAGNGGEPSSRIVCRGIVPAGAADDFPALWEWTNNMWKPVATRRDGNTTVFASRVASDPSLSASEQLGHYCVYFDTGGVLRGVELNSAVPFVVGGGQVPHGAYSDGGWYSTPVSAMTAAGLMVLALSANGMAYYSFLDVNWSAWTEMPIQDGTGLAARIGGCVRIDPRKVLIAVRLHEDDLRVKEIDAAALNARENSEWTRLPSCPRPLASVVPSIIDNQERGYRIVIPDTEGHLWTYTLRYGWEPIGGRAYAQTAVGLAGLGTEGAVAMRGVDWNAANWQPNFMHGAVWLRKFSDEYCIKESS